MKKTGKLFVSMASLGIILNNVAYAATENVSNKENGLQTKYIFMGVAALVIVLLLYLGYKMDTKENDKPSKVSQKTKKAKEKLTQKAKEVKQNDGSYEDDGDITYEEDDSVDSDDLNEIVEYTEDEEEEDSLFSSSSSSEEEPLFENDSAKTNKGIPEDAKVETAEPVENKSEEPEEKMGEEFDTSVIDSLDDEPEEETGNDSAFDETMLFNSDDFGTTGSFGSSFNGPKETMPTSDDDDDDDFSIGDDADTIISGGEEIDDSFIDELKNFEEPESNFEGFSSSKDNSKIEEKAPKKYTSAKLKETEEFEPEPEVMPETNIDISSDNDFLSQMEANLQKNKADRDAKKVSKTTTKKSTKKIDD